MSFTYNYICAVCKHTTHVTRFLDLLGKLSWNIRHISPSSEPKDLSFDIIEHYPIGVEKPPLVLFPHGGPHSAFAGDYQISSAFLVSLGYAVLMVNYRGSTGFGADFLNALPGRCGELDINDCVDSILHVFDEGKADPNRLAVIGGSHGGFIAGHLIGKDHPRLRFKACVMRNPVTDIAGMLVATDIPDW
jgi:acylaminoacyl-peptidase